MRKKIALITLALTTLAYPGDSQQKEENMNAKEQ